jgi:hypothetical protein
MLMYAAIEFGVTWYIVEMISVLKYCKTVTKYYCWINLFLKVLISLVPGRYSMSHDVICKWGLRKLTTVKIWLLAILTRINDF